MWKQKVVLDFNVDETAKDALLCISLIVNPIDEYLANSIEVEKEIWCGCNVPDEDPYWHKEYKENKTI